MRKLFKRREFLRQEQRAAAEAFGLAWVIRSWLDPTWGEIGGLLWWFNFALSCVVVLAMCTLVVTKAKVPPVRKLSAPGFGIPVIESPLVPGDQIFVMNPDLRAKLSGPIEMPVRPFQFQEWGPRQPSEHRPYLRTCPNEWFTENRCPKTHIDGGKHRCSRNAAHTLRDDCCLCDCGKASPKPEAGSVFEQERKLLHECGYRFGHADDCMQSVEGTRCRHTCVSPAGHEVEDDFPHHCHCGATDDGS